MHKSLKFIPQLVPLILSGEKVSTWRLYDDKNITVGDIVDFIQQGTGTHFATVKITTVVEKPLGKLTAEDKKGHEQYMSDVEMVNWFAKVYKREVTLQTKVKLVHFTLLP